MDMKKLFFGILMLASIPFLIRASCFVYYHTFADKEARLRYELSDFHYAQFFITHARILNMHNGNADFSDQLALKYNKEMMKDEGYTDQKICIMELDAENAAIKEWLKKH